MTTETNSQPAPPAEPVASGQNTAPAAAASSAPEPSAAPATVAVPKQSASKVLGTIFGVAASVVNGMLPAIPKGAVTAAAFAGEEALRAIGQFLVSDGADNALTEAQAEAQLKVLLASLATIAQPLPTPAEIEAGNTAAGFAADPAVA